MRFLPYIVVAFMAFGAFEARELVRKDNGICSDTETIDYCKTRLRKHSEKLGKIEKFTSEKDLLHKINAFRKTCRPLKRCLSSVEHCDIFGRVKTSFVINLVETYCDLADQISEPCFQRLEDSKCANNWNPFLSEEDIEDEETRAEACLNFFGKNRCMERVITRKCGKKEWKRFHDNLVRINHYAGMKCDLGYVVLD